MTVLQTAGLSHSETRGSKVICTYPRIIAAYHVLHRLQEPRHPPYALELVEMRGVEPLSEGSLAGPSPSADCDLKFPHDDARSQASAIGSFMLRTHGKAYMRSFPA